MRRRVSTETMELCGYWVVRLREGFADSVIPGRAEGANPESSSKLGILGWIPGPTLRVVPE
ncbi:hypothetical protein PQJ75_20480 [Rhodoplanes sp. TEM]|uniref:Uncharacterized protein n=1 Tax=Rhodoplanes tepidamans TaxID=200616 RepID=A0ABT5JJD2_RHOTP|nr:hypothetical protein [Rhodoplanes tepidamans]MDC7789483.1 hypothetical protein [Rhodoplanes tepidamans]MDC7986113.1 hypothetical protein [Rhodoplanes sp. TEM]MDQ0358900.1 hypothetical protein [Rhodoplanes tepidamans]